MLYTSFLRKHMGWFDDREHNPAVLTSSMAEKATKINNGTT